MITDSILQRFWNLVIVDQEDFCWRFKGYKDKFGYGQFWYNGHYHKPHRFIYEALNGPLSGNLQVMHTCNVPDCCNPKHLKAVSPEENSQYKWKSNRLKAGPTGCVGVVYDEKRKKFRVKISENAKKRTIYWGNDFFEACCARKSWESSQCWK
jgi:hypothetical protein